MNQLTTRQIQVLDFIKSFTKEHGWSPTLREMQAHFGLASPFGVQRHIRALVIKGALLKQNGRARARVAIDTPLKHGGVLTK